MFGRRLLTLLVVLGAIALPAGVLHALCVGRSCGDASQGTARVPFCPLPAALKEDIANGYRDGRSPDVLGVVRRGAPVYSPTGPTDLRIPWPATGGGSDTRVPIVFSGTGIASNANVPDGTTLDRIAPTVSEAIGLDRPFPNVRSGTAIPTVADGDRPELVLLVAWKGIGTAELRNAPGEWPFLTSLLEGDAGTIEGSTGSVPLDPAATLTTIGTGGLPSQHGITGSFVRNDDGDVVAAFGDRAPVTVIATLADDLDEATGQRSAVSLVATDETDRGLIGTGWAYDDRDTDRVALAPSGGAVAAVRTVLARARPDGVADLLGVVLEGGVSRLDRWTSQIVHAARVALDGSVLVVVAGTGQWDRVEGSVPDTALVEGVEDAVPGATPIVAATVPGGLFLDRPVMTEAGVTGQVAVDALFGATDPNGRPVIADAFQGFAVSFARYC